MRLLIRLTLLTILMLFSGISPGLAADLAEAVFVVA